MCYFIILMFICHGGSLNFLCSASVLQKDYHVALSRTMLLTCNVDLSKETTWTFEGELINVNRIIINNKLAASISLDANYSLLLSSVSFQHEGVYECLQGSNLLRKYSLEVEVSPKLSITVDGLFARTERQVELNAVSTITCIAAKAKPNVTLTIVINGKAIHPELISFDTSLNPNNKTFDSTATTTSNFSQKTGNISCVSSGLRNFEEQRVSINYTLRVQSFEENPTSSIAAWSIPVTLGIVAVLLVVTGLFFVFVQVTLGRRPRRLVGSKTISLTDEMNNIPNHRDDPQVPSNLKKSWLTLSNVPNEYSKDDVKLHEELPSEGLIKCWVAQVHLKCDKKRLITVKSISDCATVKELQAFRSLLNTIHNLPKHRNCVEILGVTTTEAPPPPSWHICVTRLPYYVYQEFVENGNLRDSLLRNFQETGDNQQCNDKQEQRDSMQLLTQYSIQVADGMSFLAENKYCHPGLSAKKILLEGKHNCKLYDFWPASLASIRITELLQKPVPPIAWMAPETVFLKQYVAKSDLWTYGTVLWEIFSFGGTPYKGLSIHEIELCIRDQQYLAQPLACPGGIYSMILSLWDTSMDKRPDFPEVTKMLSGTLKTSDTGTTLNNTFKLSSDPKYYTLNDHYSKEDDRERKPKATERL